jgi:hypothetical protein
MTDDGHQVMAKAHIAFGKVCYGRKHLWQVLSLKSAHFVMIHYQTWPPQAILVSDWPIFNLHVVSEKKIIKNFSQSEAFMAPGSHVGLTDRNESNNTWLDHANEHSYHVSSHLLQWFSRRRLKCIRTDDRRNVMAIARVR